MKRSGPAFLLAAAIIAAVVPLSAQAPSQAAAQAAPGGPLTARHGADVYTVATFDSGFGGFFTAKEIEKQERALSAEGYGPFQIAHYGDTTNAPYGEKTPEQIASLASAGILAAFRDGARDVFIACNTASTQIDRIREIVRAEDPSYPNHVYSILDVSVREIMKTVSAKLRTEDTVVVAILATPATVKSENYPRLLARALNTTFTPGVLTRLTQPRWLTSKGAEIDSYAYTAELALGPAKKVVIHLLAPANWVEMIENGAPEAEKRDAVRRDLEMLVGWTTPGTRFDVVGEFCTHYPVFDSLIQSELRRLGRVADGVPFVVQGPIMAALFRSEFLQQHPAKAPGPVAPPATPAFYMTGTNVESTRELIRRVFPGEPEPVIARKAFVAPK